MHTELRNHATEGALLAVFLAWLIWLPMPFGSVIDSARLPLIVVPLALCLLAALVRFATIQGNESKQINAWRIWTIGSLLFLAAIALQLVPLPPSLLRVLSPQSANLWAGSDRVVALLGAPLAQAHPISIDPGATAREWFRMLALFATFMTSSLLVRTHWRRIAFAVALIGAATFEFIYGVNEAALRRYAIWGWKNKFMFNRVTGTYVNPNHFAHYLAIVLPMALFIAAWAWHHAAPGTPFGRRVARLLEKNVLPFGVGALGAIGCLAGILVGQSRGALLAVFCGIAIVALIAMARTRAFRSSRRRRALFVVGGTLSSVVLLTSLVIFLGRDRTIQRFTPSEGETVTLVGRTIGAKIAFGTWKEFPIFGSGAGTFVNVSGMVQSDFLQNLFDHAHDDYLEIAATTGALGFAIAIVTLLAGYWSLVRITFGDGSVGSFRRCAFQGAALTSITVAMVHAFFDFNFFIPANPATLAAIAGAAVAAYSRSFDADATADRVARHRVRKPHVDPMDAA
jgi:putative inorganic carbon (HCO3(-)) transporter